MGALSHLRVVEVSDDIGAYAGKLFAELGASVVRVSTTVLDPLKTLQIDPDPFVQDFLHRSKHQVELPADPGSRTDVLARLIERADVLREAGPPDLLERLGVPAEHPCLMSSSLVRTRITPYGIEGDRAKDPASDLVCSASAGFLSLGAGPIARRHVHTGTRAGGWRASMPPSERCSRCSSGRNPDSVSRWR